MAQLVLTSPFAALPFFVPSAIPVTTVHAVNVSHMFRMRACSLLYRFYSLMAEHTALQDRVRALEAALEAALGRPAVGGTGGAAAATAAAAEPKKGAAGGKGFFSGKGAAAPEPSAPPAPAELLGKLGAEAAPEPKKHK